MNARREWAQRFIDRHPGPPSYGSPEFLALAEGHPAKISSLVVAAESWARDGDELEARLRVEVMALSRAHKREEDAEYVDRIRARAGYYDRRPDKAEIETEFWSWVRGDVA